MPSIELVATDIRRQITGGRSWAGASNDLEYLARLFEDDTISDIGSGNDLQRRLLTILEASSDGGVTHFAKIFGGCHDTGFQAAFKDPFPSSNNQVGHFMTAVDMGYRPGKTFSMFNSQSPGVMPRSGIPQDEYICISLIIAHEQISDSAWFNLLRAAVSANFSPSEDIPKFYQALGIVPLSPSGNVTGPSAALRGIPIGTGIGNSIQDLLLSLYGFKFGRLIRQSQLTSRANAVQWLRSDLGGASAPDLSPTSTAFA